MGTFNPNKIVYSGKRRTKKQTGEPLAHSRMSYAFQRGYWLIYYYPNAKEHAWLKENCFNPKNGRIEICYDIEDDLSWFHLYPPRDGERRFKLRVGDQHTPLFHLPIRLLEVKIKITAGHPTACESQINGGKISFRPVTSVGTMTRITGTVVKMEDVA